MPVALESVDDARSLSIVVKNPSSYLPRLGRYPFLPRPSLSLISHALDQLRILYVENNHNHGNDLPGNMTTRKIKKKSVELAWEEEVERVRADAFEYTWSQKWLINWISYAASWLSELESPCEEEENGETDESISSKESLSMASDCSDIEALVNDIHREQKKTIEKLLDSASSIMAACGGTSASGAVERKFRFDYGDEGEEQIMIKLRDETLNDYDSVGVQTWASAVLLSSDICARPAYFGLVPPPTSPSSSPSPSTRPLKVLELGAGTGLLGLTSIKVLEKTYANSTLSSEEDTPQVIMTDYHHLVLDNLKHNLVFNKLHNDLESSERPFADVGIRSLDWKDYYNNEKGQGWREFDVNSIPNANVNGDAEDGDEEHEEVFDVILGADIVYAPDHVHWIASTVRTLLRRPTATQVFTEAEPSFHLIFALRLSHYEELNIIKEVFNAKRYPDNLAAENGKTASVTSDKNKWNVVIVEERHIERKQKNLGRQDEIEYFAWRLAWRPVPPPS